MKNTYFPFSKLLLYHVLLFVIFFLLMLMLNGSDMEMFAGALYGGIALGVVSLFFNSIVNFLFGRLFKEMPLKKKFRLWVVTLVISIFLSLALVSFGAHFALIIFFKDVLRGN